MDTDDKSKGSVEETLAVFRGSILAVETHNLLGLFKLYSVRQKIEERLKDRRKNPKHRRHQ